MAEDMEAVVELLTKFASDWPAWKWTDKTNADLRALLSERRKMVEALSVFGRAVDDGPGGNTEGVPDETPVRMFFADPEFDGEDTLLGEPFMRAFRTAAALSGSREHGR